MKTTLAGLILVCASTALGQGPEPAPLGRRTGFNAPSPSPSQERLIHHETTPPSATPRPPGGMAEPYRGETLDDWIAKCKAPDPNVRRNAAWTLGKMGPPAQVAIPTLVELLKDRYPIPGHAALALAKIGPEAKVAIPAIITFVKSQSLDSRCGVEALGKFGPEAKAAVPILLEWLQDETNRDRGTVVQTLAAIGPDAKAAIPVFAAMLKESTPQTAQLACQIQSALGTMGPEAIPVLLNVLQDPPEWSNREHAVCALEKIGPAAILALAERLKHDDCRVRRVAAWTLAQISWHLRDRKTPGIDPKTMVAPLVAALQDKDWRVRIQAATALPWIDPTAIPRYGVKGEFHGGVVEFLADKTPQVREAIVWAVDMIEFPQPTSIRLLKTGTAPIASFATLLDHAEPDIRFAAVQALGNAAYEAKLLGNATFEMKAIFPPITKALQDKDAEVRQAAAGALERIGSAAKPAIPALVKALEDNDKKVRSRAARALGSIGPAAMPMLDKLQQEQNPRLQPMIAIARRTMAGAAGTDLLQWLHDGDKNAVLWTMACLGSRGEDAEFAIPALAELLHDKDPKIREAAVRALGDINPAAVIVALTPLLRDQDVTIRRSAAWALRSVGPSAQPAMSALIPMLRDKDERVSLDAALAVRVFGIRAKAAVPILIELVSSRNPEIQKAALGALSGMGEEAQAAIPTLVKLSHDKDPKTRLAAVSTLGVMGPPAESFLKEALKDEDPEVRASAQQSLHWIDVFSKHPRLQPVVWPQPAGSKP